jgi:O-antigen/teichoic acid export membrane protein
MGIIKKVFGASAIIVLASGLTRLFTLLSAPVLTRLLGPAPYGTMALVGTAVAFASTLSLLGMDMSYARYYFSKENVTSHAVEQFCWRYTIFSSTGVGILAALFWWYLFGRSMNNSLIALMVGLTSILFVANTMSQTWARLRERYNQIGLAIIISGMVTVVISMFLAIVWRRDEWSLLIGFAAGILINIVVIGTPKSNLLLKASGLTLKEKWPIIKLGLPGVITASMYWILSSADRWFLKYFMGKEIVGIYSFAYSVAIVGQIVNTAIILTWIPESIRTYEADTHGATSILGEVWGGLALSLSLVWLIVASIGGDIIRILAHSQFHSGAVYVPWIAGGVYFYGMSILATSGLLIAKNMKPAAGLWFMGGVLNVILNYFAIQKWGAYGAAVVNCVSFGFIYFGVMWKSLKLFKLNLAWKKLFGVAVIVLMCGVVMSPAWHSYPLISICLKLPLCLGVSLCLSWLTVPGWVRQIKVQLARIVGEKY